MKSLFIFCLSFIVFGAAYSQVYPPPSCIEYQNGNLTICPPDSVPGYTGGLIGYNVYIDNEFIDNLPAGSPDDTVTMVFDPLPLPGYRTFCATAVYLNWISDSTCETSLVYYGYSLPFTEDWSSGSFETNSWSQEGDYWMINEEVGDEAPSVEFMGNAGLTNYSVPFTSYTFKADSIIEGSVRIEFYLKLDCDQNTGNEKLIVQVWDWANQSWLNVLSVTNANGNFDWTKYTSPIYNAEGRLFKIRFLAIGVNSNDIESWRIDNIELYRTCHAPDGLLATLNDDDHVELNWGNYVGCGEWGNFMWWHSGNYSGNSIGTDGPVEFDVAVRWTTDMLALYGGESISRIYFFPAESNATYSVRIWEGDEAILVKEKTAQEIVTGQWNFVSLDTAHIIDITQTLWVGYHIVANTGYPAGVDDGPAANGYGNMMYWENQWQTLLDINPELDYNWLIEAYLGTGDPEYCGSRVYRKINDGDYLLIADIGMTDNYIDEDANSSDLNCYLVTNFVAKNYDTCESPYSNESCILPVNIQDPSDEADLKIYPNPASNVLYINSSSEIFEIQIIDVTGRVVYYQRKPDLLAELDVSYLKEGIYFIKINWSKGLVIRKILIR